MGLVVGLDLSCGSAEFLIFAEPEANAFIPRFTAEHSEGHSGKAS